MTMLMLLAVAAANASAMAKVRFIQAAPGAGVASLAVVSGGFTANAGGDSAFGEVTPYAATPSGPVTLKLVSSTSHSIAHRTLAAGGSYTVIALGVGRHPSLQVYSDAKPVPGVARLRLIHAAPELGAPDVRVGGRVVAQGLKFRQSTGYLELPPGSYPAEVMSPHSQQPILSGQLTLSAGTATTAIVTGTGGAPEKLVVAADSTAAPGGPPETGLGGLATGGGAPWLLIALAALAGGTVAGSGRLAFARRAARR